MALYVTVSAGDRAETAKPVLAVGDQQLIRKMLALVPDSLGAERRDTRDTRDDRVVRETVTNGR